jgi:hypothetical protein
MCMRMLRLFAVQGLQDGGLTGASSGLVGQAGGVEALVRGPPGRIAAYIQL